jgi:hypothetical protein
MRLLMLSFIFILLLSANFSAQTNSSPDSGKLLRKLELDITTPDDAIKLFGQPVGDNPDELDAEFFDANWRIKKNQKVFRKLTFAKIEETEKLHLLFHENKLVKITFDYRESKDKRVTVSDLIKDHQTDFVMIQGIAKDSKLSDYEGQKENTIPKVYPSLYALLNVQKDKVYLAIVNYSSWKSVWRQLKSKPTKEMFPGFVMEMQIISRSLEQK